MAGGFPKGRWPLPVLRAATSSCMRSQPTTAAYRGLRAPFGHPLPWGGGPCSASCYFFMYAVTAHQLHRASFLLSSPSVYNPHAPYHKRSLVARAFLFLNDQVQSLAHTHMGSSPIVGPLFGQTSGFLLFSVSDRIYGVPFSLSAPRVASDVPQGPEYPPHRYRYPSCLPRKCHLHTMLSGHFFFTSSPILYAVIRTARVCSKLGVRPLIF
jgi:hypothetical protein